MSYLLDNTQGMLLEPLWGICKVEGIHVQPRSTLPGSSEKWPQRDEPLMHTSLGAHGQG